MTTITCLPPRTDSNQRVETRAAAYLAWSNQGVGDALAMFRKQVGMPLGNVPFPLVGQLDLSVQVGTVKM